MSQQAGHSLTQGTTFISTDQETTGFDLSSGSKWIYPENYPRRDYQFSIVQTALYNNTLVCLPTGLGKTFIAAVVMYNFWRWYPIGRVVFLAPTKPLVAQQIHACHEIMGIPSGETVELTGAINQIKRREAWTKKRVIFATPQTFQKDLQNNCVPCELIKCIVIDEAHKALGNHSYCEIIRMVNEKSKFFRVLALSATPGSKIDHVREVIQNLLISELELRDDTSPDITPYTNSRSMEQVIVGLGKILNQYKDRYVNIMDPHVRILIKNNILQGNTANISKGRIFMLMKQYESRSQKASNHGIIMKTLNILLTMYHAYELLIKHGIRAFYNFYGNHSDKYWLDAEVDLQLMLEDIKRCIGIFPVIDTSPDAEIPDIPDGLIFGHAKFDKLRDLLVDHFKSFSEQNKSTRAIVFVEYRDIVNEVYVLLLQKRPLIRPQMFVGQAGQKQKQQLAALEDFRSNKVNVLISTSVGEEGLDVGEVDLIVCFDISTSTPTRLVQRMGRTGRKRNGRVVLLLTEGKEVQTLNQAISKKDSLNSKVLESSNISSSLYQSSPRMVPANITPECMSIYIKAQPKTPTVKGRKPKAPVEKKPRKKKKDAVPSDEPEPSTSGISAGPSGTQSKSKAGSNAKPSSSQSSMMRFLTGGTQKIIAPSCNYDDTDVVFEEFQSVANNKPNNPYVTITPHEVKLLTSDSHALDFLTLCAMKRSEQTEPNVIKIDTTWIPPRSPVDISLNDFVVPSLDTLDCIKDLAVCEGPMEKEIQSNLDYFEDDFEINHKRVSMDVENVEVDEFKELVVQSKYAENTKRIQEDLENLDSTFFEEFSTESKYADKPVEEEIVTSDFFDNDFSMPDSKNDSSRNNNSSNQNNNINNSGEAKEPKVSEVARTPAHVEVDFDDILDEYSESDVSEADRKPLDEPNIFDDLLEGGSEGDRKSPDEQNIFDELLEGVSEANRKPLDEPNICDDLLEGGSEGDRKSPDEMNIFDDLLNEVSTDEDMFEGNRNDQNATIVPNDGDNDHTLVESPKLSLKRSRSSSHSPCKESVKKRLKTTQDSLDSEVLGTPPKLTKRRSNLSCIAEEAPKVNAVAVESDSDEDLFDDIEFETQFTFAIDKNKVKSKEVVKKEETRDEALSGKSIQNCRLEESFDRIKSNLSLEMVRDEVKNQENTKDHFSFGELSVLNSADKTMHQGAEDDRVEGERLSGKDKDDSRLNNNKIMEDIDDFDLGDWTDFDFAPLVVQKDKIEEENVSSFFREGSSKSCTSQKTQKEIHPFFTKNKNSQKPSTSKSSWITIEKSKSSQNPPKRPLAFKNINNLSLSKPPKLPEQEDDPPDKKPLNFPGKNNDEHRVLFIHQTRHPSLSLLSLKRKYTEPATKDLDGFALPHMKPKVSPKPKPPEEFTTWKVPKVLCANKENKLPKHSMSPRFRKYHSENNLSVHQERRKRKNLPRARKRIANDFIEDEAEQSDDVDTSEGSSCEGEEDMDNFVSYTQDVGEHIDMRAHYMQSVNMSPIRPGNFIFKKVRNAVPDHEVFSQPMTQADESYMHDSFCVGDTTQHIVNDDSLSEDSLLEDIEARLEDRRSKRRRKREEKFANFKLKRKRTRNERNLSGNDSSETNVSSSEDETEALRKQILEESMMMKK